MNKLGSLIVRVVKWLLIIELCYVVLINTALQLSLTQDLINMIRPEKFRISWDSAWSWYPFRVKAEGVFVNGQSRSQQWQVQVGSGTGSINLLPLVLKRVHVNFVDAIDVEYRQRPRLKPDKDYTAIQEYFPAIDGREIQPADTSPRKSKRPWKVSLRNIRASGQLSYWIFNLKGSGEGSALADLKIETRGGPFSMDVQDIDLRLAPAFLNSAVEVFHGGTVTGQLGFVPFVPRENKGIRMLPFLKLDAELDVEVAGLRFINLFTANLGDLVIDGAGHVGGRVRYAQGYMLAGTDLMATAADLSVHVKDMDVVGEGAVRIHTPPEADKPLGLGVGFDGLAITRQDDAAPFLTGKRLNLAYSGSNYVVPDPELDFQAQLGNRRVRERLKHNTLKILIEDATLLNMSIVNDYLPPETPLQFSGGTATVQADLFAEAEDIEGSVQLDSSNLEMDIDGQALQGDLAAELIVVGGVPRNMQVDLSGSSLSLTEVSVVGERESFEGDYWSTQVNFDRAGAVLTNPPQFSTDARLTISDTRPVVALFGNHGEPPRWLSGLLTLKDIEGAANLELADERLAIPSARVISDKAEVAAKAVFYEAGRDGVIYARYKKLDVLLKMDGDKNNLDVIKVRKKFDAYKLAH